MKRLPYTTRRVAFRVSLAPRPGIAAFQAGIVRGHFVVMERAWFDKRPCWVRYYELEVLSGPSSVLGSIVRVCADDVFRWPNVRQSSVS